jgi:protein TonB
MGMGKVEPRSLGAFSRIGVVVGMHAALLFVLVRGMGVRIPLPEAPDPVETRIIDQTPPVDPLPRTVDPPRTDTQIWVPEPEDPPMEHDDQIQEKLITGTQTPGDPHAGAGTALPQPQILGARIDGRHPLSQPPYPPSRIRFNDEGAVDLEIYVMPDGRVGDARILKSSGFEDFDRSALQEARRNWHMLPATRDGQPVAQWYALRVVFKLKNAR